MLREDPRDAFVLKAGRSACALANLPAGSVIGTSSIRRTAQIALRYPHLRVQDVRGNVPTRLAKLDVEKGAIDALILAAAGLIRLGLGDRISQYLDSVEGGMLYAVGQGAIGIEIRSDDKEMAKVVARIEDKPTSLVCHAERSLLRKLEGGCSAPLGVESTWIEGGDKKGQLQMKSIVVSVNGKESAQIEMYDHVNTKEDAEDYGVRAAEYLLSRGADSILKDIKAKKPSQVTDL